jgi:hypothetical protein
MQAVSGYFSLVNQFIRTDIPTFINMSQMFDRWMYWPNHVPGVSIMSGCLQAAMSAPQLIGGATLAGWGAVSYGVASCFQVAEWSRDSLVLVEFGGRFAWHGVTELATAYVVVWPVVGNLAYYLWNRFMDGSQLINLIPRGMEIVSPVSVMRSSLVLG